MPVSSNRPQSFWRNSDVLLRNNAVDIPPSPLILTKLATFPVESKGPISSEATLYFGRRCNRALQHLLTMPETEALHLERLEEGAASSANNMFRESNITSSTVFSNINAAIAPDLDQQSTVAQLGTVSCGVPSLGSTRLIIMMGFLSLLKPISEISLGLGLSIRGSPDSEASASKSQLNWPRESLSTYFSLDNSLLFDQTSGNSEGQN
jgi:hypothetical protein